MTTKSVIIAIAVIVIGGAASALIAVRFMPINGDANGDRLAEIQRGPLPEETSGELDIGPMPATPRRPPPTFGAAQDASAERREQALKRFVDDRGPESVVVIRIVNADGLRPGALVKELTRSLGVNAFFATRPASTVVMAIGYAGDVGDVTELIDWGTVSPTKNDDRVIFVDGNR